MRNRVIGCLLAGALGDAWGGPWEGRAGPVEFEIPAHHTLSDDTQLTVATCESIIEAGGVEAENLAARFVQWFQTGRIRGMGPSTLKAMRDLAAGTHWALAGARGEFRAGNGAAMRIAPRAVVLDPADSKDRVTIRDVCRITHHNDEACVGALAVILAIRAVMNGAYFERGSLLASVVDDLPDTRVRDRILELMPAELPRAELARRFGRTGHVADSVPLALFCAQEISSAGIDVILARAISLGGDTDTIASITGQIAGCVVGSGGVPQSLLRNVEGMREVEAIACAFADFVVKRVGT